MNLLKNLIGSSTKSGMQYVKDSYLNLLMHDPKYKQILSSDRMQGKLDLEQLKELRDMLKNDNALLYRHESLVSYLFALVTGYETNLQLRQGKLVSLTRIRRSSKSFTCYFIRNPRSWVCYLPNSRYPPKNNEVETK